MKTKKFDKGIYTRVESERANTRICEKYASLRGTSKIVQ